MNWLEDVDYKTSTGKVYINFINGLVSIDNLSLEDKEYIYKDLMLGKDKMLK